MNLRLVLVALFLYWIYPYWPPPKVTTSSTIKCYGLHTYPNTSLVLQRFYLVLSAIQLHSHFYLYSNHLPAEKHLSRNYPCYLANLVLPAYLHALRAPKYVTDGFQVYQVLPRFFKARLAQLFSDLGGSTCYLLRHKPRFRPF